VSTPAHEWPALEAGYEDQFGPIDPEVYEAAGAIWPKAAKFGEFALQDRSLAFNLMLKAVASVSSSIAAGRNVEHLKAYLLRSYKNLVVTEREKLLKESIPEFSQDSVMDIVTDLERKILLREMFTHMSTAERTLVYHSMMGYSYEEIANLLGLNPATVRQRMHRLTERLRKTIDFEDTET